MRLFRFLNATYGLRALRDRRLRIGRIEELNDEFEFIGLALAQKEDRIAMRKMRQHLGERNGILCMSADWHSPLLWGHYADAYRGVALEFEVDGRSFYRVDYVDKRPTLASFGCATIDGITPEHIKTLVKTKFKAWEYEEEYRAYLALKEGEIIDGVMHYFVPFSNAMTLKAVIVGPRSPLKREAVAEALGNCNAEIYRSRADFDDFRMVRNHDESMWR